MFKLNDKTIRGIFFLSFIVATNFAQAAITFVANSSANSANNSLSIAQPTGTAVNDVMVAQIARRGGAPEVFTPPAGWIEIGTGLHLGGSGSNTYKHRAYYRVVDGTEAPPFVWNFSGNRNNVGGITTYRGVDTSNPININSQLGLTTNANSIAATGVTTTVDGAMLIAMYGVNSDKTYTTPAGGYTPRYEQLSPASNIEIKSFDVIQALAGPTGSPSTSWTGNVNRRVARLIALTPAAVIGGTTAYIVSSGLVGNQNYTGSLGMDFDVVSGITITDLGAFDSGSNGLSRTITVQLFDRNNTGTPLAQLTFTPGAPGTLEGGSRIKTLGTPLNLPAGFQGSIVASNYGAGEPNYNTGGGTIPSLTTDDGGGLISFVGSARYGTANLYPTNIDGGPVNRYGAGTFKFSALTPIAEWRMDEASWSGTVGEVVDNTGNGNDGTVNNGAVTANTTPAIAGDPGTCGYGTFTQSSSQFVNVPYNASLNPDGDFTVTFWAKVNGSAGTWRSPITSRWENGGATIRQGYIVYAGSNNLWQFWTGVGAAGWDVTTGPAVTIGAWTHVAITYNSTSVAGGIHTGIKSLYINGVATTNNNRNYQANGTNPTTIGAGGGTGSTFYFDGDIDEMRIYDSALSSGEISTIMNETHPCPSTNIPEMEVAEITLNDTSVTPSFTSVTFKQTYTTTPLVFILPSNEGGADPASIRIQNVTTTGFQVSQVEPETQDGPHAAMTVHYLAIEPGVHELPDGTTIEAGTNNTTSVQHGTGVPGAEAWDTVNFSTTFASQAAVLAGIQGMVNESNNPPTTTSIPWLVPAVRNEATNSVQLALGRGEVNDGGIVSSNESIGYVAIEGDVQGSFASGAATILYESITSADTIAGWDTENCPTNVGQAVPFVNTYTQNPLVIGNISRHDGGDGGWIRRCSLTTSQIGVAVDEDQFRDTERNHTNEAASFLVFSEEFCLPTACPISTVDHYKISFPNGNSGLTCEASVVEITAHDVNDQPIVVPAGIILNITTSTGTGTWGPAGSAPLVGTGTWTPSGANDGIASYTWPGGESSFQVDLTQTAAVTMNINLLDNAGKSESTIIAAEDPSITFSARGLRFSVTGASANAIDNQISGKDNNQVPGQTIYMQVVRTQAGACNTNPPGGGTSTLNVQLAAECINPSTCAGQQVSVENNVGTPVAINTYDNGSVPGSGSWTSVPLTFSRVTGLMVNPFVFNYPDAGEIVIHASLTIGGGGGWGGTYTVASNNFVVRPFGFDVQVPTGTPPHATGPGGNDFTQAGNAFTVTSRAVQWQLADDGNNDGIPDGHQSGDTDPTNNANLANNGSTPNYGQENYVAEADITLSALLNQPGGGNDPGLTGGTSISSYTAGSGNTTTAQYDEVGIIEVRAGLVDGDYLGAGQILGVSGYVGRFVPYVFEATPNTPEFDPACGTFSYIGQGFTYTTSPVINLTAKAKGTAPAFGTTTQNYTGTFLKLTDAKLVTSGSKTYAAASGSLDTSLVPSPDPVIADTGSGTATLTFSDGGGITFNRGNPQDPFDADIALSINVLDEDDVFAGNGSGVNQNPISFGAATAGNGIAFTGGNKEQRWGRLVLDNAFGSELLPVEIPVRAEYQSSGDFITNANDSCTPYTSANISFSNHSGITAGANLTASGTGTLISGIDDDANPLIISNSLLETGSVDVTHAIDFWLQYDWDNDTNHDNAPSSRATWGIFSGPDEFIYIREPW